MDLHDQIKPPVDTESSVPPAPPDSPESAVLDEPQTETVTSGEMYDNSLNEQGEQAEQADTSFNTLEVEPDLEPVLGQVSDAAHKTPLEPLIKNVIKPELEPVAKQPISLAEADVLSTEEMARVMVDGNEEPPFLSQTELPPHTADQLAITPLNIAVVASAEAEKSLKTLQPKPETALASKSDTVVDAAVYESEPEPRRHWSGLLWGYPILVLIAAVLMLRMLASQTPQNFAPSPDQSRITLGLMIAFVLLSVAVIASDADMAIGDFFRRTRRGMGELWRNRDETSRVLGENATQVRVLSTAAAVIFMATAAWTFNPITNREGNNWQIGWLYIFAGAIAVGVSLFAGHNLPIFDQPILQRLKPLRANAAVTVSGVGLLLLLSEINGRAFKFQMFERVSYTFQAILFYGGIFLVVWGISGAQRIRPLETLQKWATLETLTVFAIFGMGLFLRGFGSETGLRASIDEAIPIEGVFNVWNNSPVGLVSAPSQYMTTLVMSQWQTVAINFFDTTITGLRAANVFVGALTVFAVYLLTKELFDRKTALLAALLIAVFPPHIHFSRISLIHIADPFFGTLAIAFVIRGLKHNRRLDWALAGAALGMTQYFFEAGRLFFVPLILGWLVVMVFFLWGRLRFEWRGIAVMGVVFVFVALPAYYSIVAQNKLGAHRLGVSGLSGEFWSNLAQDGITVEEFGQLINRFVFPFTVYLRQRELAEFYGGQNPLLLVYVVPFFLLGSFYILWRWRSTALIIVIWIAATALVNAFLRDSAHFPRWVVVFPAIPIAVAVGIRYFIPRLLPARYDNALFVPMIALVTILAVGQTNYYHYSHLPDLMVQIRKSKPYPDTMDAIFRANNFVPRDTDIYMVSDPISDIHVPRAWMDFQRTGENLRLNVVASPDFSPDYLKTLPQDRPLCFLVQIDDTRSQDLIRLMYPLYQEQRSPYNVQPASEEFILFYVPLETPAITVGQLP